jgi:hypothetical protein
MRTMKKMTIIVRTAIERTAISKREEKINTQGKGKRSRNYGGDAGSDGSDGPDCDDELRDSINTS